MSEHSYNNNHPRLATCELGASNFVSSHYFYNSFRSFSSLGCGSSKGAVSAQVRAWNRIPLVMQIFYLSFSKHDMSLMMLLMKSNVDYLGLSSCNGRIVMISLDLGITSGAQTSFYCINFLAILLGLQSP